MERIVLTNTNIQEAALRAAEVLRARGVIVYPTDTLYGLGADAFSDEAVTRVYAIKGRDEKKPIHCVVSDLRMAEQFAEVNSEARRLAGRFLPGPLTLVLRKRPDINSGIAKTMTTIGIRIPDNEFCLSLAKTFGPYTTTSANIAGAEDVRTVDGIVSQLSPPAQALERTPVIDLAIDAGELPQQKASTVVDVSSGDIKILREGAIPALEILQ